MKQSRLQYWVRVLGGALFWLNTCCAPAPAQDFNTLAQEAQRGRLDSEYKLGKMYLEQGDTEQALFWLRKAAAQKYGEAEMELASMYQHGKGVAQDDREAFEWCLKAATHGNDRAQTIVGIDYQFGESGAARDLHIAARWFRMAARQNNAEAQRSLTEMSNAKVISEKEADWRVPEPSDATGPKRSEQAGAKKAFSLDEVERGLVGGITNKRMVMLIQQYGVNFALTLAGRQRLSSAGADDYLLSVVADGKK